MDTGRGIKKLTERSLAFLAGAAALAAALEVALRLLGAFYATAPYRPAKAPGAGFTVLCLGDSFTFGAGAPSDFSYPRQLEAELKKRWPGTAVTVVNLGEMGQNSAQLLARLPQALGDAAPDAAVLLVGGANFWNYWGYHTPRSAPRNNLSDHLRIYKLARLLWRGAAAPSAAAGPRAGAVGPPPRDAAYDACFRLMSDPKKYPAAISACRKVAAEHTGDARLLRELGLTLMHAGRAEEGLAWARRAIDAAPAELRNYEIASMGYRHLGRAAEAEEWLKLGAVRSGGSDPAAFEGPLDIQRWLRLDLDKIADTLSGSGVKVIVQNYPWRDRNNPNPDLLRASRILRETAEERGLPFVDQAGEFERRVAANGKISYFAYKDVHCSAAGYALMAKLVADKMAENGLPAGK